MAKTYDVYDSKTKEKIRTSNFGDSISDVKLKSRADKVKKNIPSKRVSEQEARERAKKELINVAIDENKKEQEANAGQEQNKTKVNVVSDAPEDRGKVLFGEKVQTSKQYEEARAIRRGGRLSQVRQAQGNRAQAEQREEGRRTIQNPVSSQNPASLSGTTQPKEQPNLLAQNVIMPGNALEGINPEAILRNEEYKKANPIKKFFMKDWGKVSDEQAKEFEMRGGYAAEGKYLVTAFGSGVIAGAQDTGKLLREVATNPGNTGNLLNNAFSNFIPNTIEQAVTNPAGLSGRVAFDIALGKGAGTGLSKVRPARVTTSQGTPSLTIEQGGNIVSRSKGNINVESGLIFRKNKQFSFESELNLNRQKSFDIPAEVGQYAEQITQNSNKLLSDKPQSPNIKPQSQEVGRFTGREAKAGQPLDMQPSKEVYSGDIITTIYDNQGKAVKQVKNSAELQIFGQEQNLFIDGELTKLTNEIIDTPKQIDILQSKGVTGVKRGDFFGLKRDKPTIKTTTENIATKEKSVTYSQSLSASDDILNFKVSDDMQRALIQDKQPLLSNRKPQEVISEADNTGKALSESIVRAQKKPKPKQDNLKGSASNNAEISKGVSFDMLNDPLTLTKTQKNVLDVTPGERVTNKKISEGVKQLENKEALKLGFKEKLSVNIEKGVKNINIDDILKPKTSKGAQESVFKEFEQKNKGSQVNIMKEKNIAAQKTSNIKEIDLRGVRGYEKQLSKATNIDLGVATGIRKRVSDIFNAKPGRFGIGGGAVAGLGLRSNQNLMPGNAFAPGVASRQDNRQGQGQAKGQGQGQPLKPGFKPAYDVGQIFRQDTPTKQSVKNIMDKVLKPVAPVKPTLTLNNPMLKIPGFEGIAEQKKSGYNVYTREAGKRVKLNKEPLTLMQAKSLGSDVVDNTTARSFQVQAVGNTKIERKVNPGSKFNLRKGKTALRFVEKSKHLIDTQGEKQGLSVGRYLNQKKLSPKFKLKL